MCKLGAIILFGAAVVAAVPQPIIRKLDVGLRYQPMYDSQGQVHLVDLWSTIEDVAESARYNPDNENEYHLFTRQNPSYSQPLVRGLDALLASSNFNPNRRTAVLLHGWNGNAGDGFNSVLVNAFLEAADINVIAVDWCAGACTINYLAAIRNTVTSGEAVARFITWLNEASGSNLSQYQIVGFSLGGQQAGVVGRNLGGRADYVTGLDPAGPGWQNSNNKLAPTDGVYTEAIHTNAGASGYLQPLADGDFYPNGGIGMPGCNNGGCDHSRAVYYFAESVQSGGFTGTRCESLQQALNQNCLSPETLPMGGIYSKAGRSGIFSLTTNAGPPFSLG